MTNATLTLADIELLAHRVLRDRPPEPIGEWMRKQGHPPEDWRLMLPMRMLDEIKAPVVWPDYVGFSTILDQPMFVARRVMST